ncbi:G2/M phase-specific E3 ubiquitin-protein ligase-like [Amia ocellicauda]|uniref:G2/M phase-specific E3 ubiquitin-protein ligase-like n=1 Tax=Amia ocellicauda TaxID=2972642 RepID=UPI0034647236
MPNKFQLLDTKLDSDGSEGDGMADITGLFVFFFNSLDDVLQYLTNKVDVTKTFSICVSRSNLFQRGLQQWQRQKKSSPDGSLQVSFLGEAGIDTGALRKEFFTEMISGIEQRFFESGLDKKGKNPIYSVNYLDHKYTKTVTAGEIMAVSLAQGGPAPTFMREWCFTYLASGDIDQLELSSDDVISAYFKDILNCGYTGVISTEKSDEMIRAIVRHSTVRLTPMLQQLRKGLQLYNFSLEKTTKTNFCICFWQPDADFIMTNCVPHLSEKGTIKHTLEMDVLNYFQDFLQEAEDTTDSSEMESNSNCISVPGILQWLTGQTHKPILPNEKRDFSIHINFNHDCQDENVYHHICFPTVSACTNTITFPTMHMKSYSEFKCVMTQALKFGNTFSRV